MEINYSKGNKGDKDRIFKVTTQPKEAFSIFKLCLLLNQLSINESNIRKENNYQYNYFYPAIISCLEMSEKGIDWALEENLDKVKHWCKCNSLKFEKIQPELARVIQKRLDEYGE